MAAIWCRSGLLARRAVQAAATAKIPQRWLAFSPKPFEDIEERERLRDVMTQLRTKSEAREYLKQFAQLDSHKFAIIVLERNLSPEDIKPLSSSLAILHTFGLYPVVVHGGSNWHIEDRSPFKRMTGDIAQELSELRSLNVNVVESIERTGGRAMPILGGVFNVPEHTPDAFETHAPENFTPQIDLHIVHSAIRLGHLPIIGTLGHTSGGQTVQLNPSSAVSLLAAGIQPLKVLFIRREGGLARTDGSIVNAINLSDQVQTLQDLWQLDRTSQHRLRYVAELLQHLPRKSSVAWIPPTGLIHELFTHKGESHGTLVRRGVPITCHRSFTDLDETKLKATLEAAFGKELVKDYFDIVRPKTFWIYIAGDYEGAAVIYLQGGLPYLCKFGVNPQAQGLGIADMLWASIMRDHKDLFWRSRIDNNINNWYFQRADGSARLEKWMVFWFGLKGLDMLHFYQSFCRDLTPTFHQKHDNVFS